MTGWISWGDLGDWDWGAIIGGLAFVIALVSLWLGTIQPRREARTSRRHATIGISFQSYRFGPESRCRLAIKNGGGSDALLNAAVSLTAEPFEPFFELPMSIQGSGGEAHFQLDPTLVGRAEILFCRYDWTDDAGEHEGKAILPRMDLH